MLKSILRKRYFIIWILILSLDGFCCAQMNIYDNNIYVKLNHLEQSIYNKTYAQENLEQRIGRLEKTLHVKLFSPSMQSRIDNLYKKVFPHLQGEKFKLDSRRKVLLDMIENNLFAKNYSHLGDDIRIIQVETTVFGQEKEGSLQERLDKLAEIIPLKNINTFKINDFRGETKAGENFVKPQ